MPLRLDKRASYAQEGVHDARENPRDAKVEKCWIPMDFTVEDGESEDKH